MPTRPAWQLFGLISPREARAATWATVILVTILALIPGPKANVITFGWDKLNHIAAFAAIALLARSGWPSLGRWTLAGVLMGYGLLIEIAQAQPFIGRSFGIPDLIADAIGIALGFALAWLGAQILARTPFLIKHRAE